MLKGVKSKKHQSKLTQPIECSSIPSTTTIIDDKPMDFMDFMGGIQIDSEYMNKYEENGYVTTILQILKTELGKIRPEIVPIYSKKDENQDMQILYIYHNGSWKRETELQWVRQLLYETDNEVKDEDRNVIYLSGLIKMEKKIQDSIIAKLYPRKFLNDNIHEMNYIQNRIDILDGWFK